MGKIEKYLAKKHYRIVGYIGFLHFSTEFECHFLCLMFFFTRYSNSENFCHVCFQIELVTRNRLDGISPLY